MVKQKILTKSVVTKTPVPSKKTAVSTKKSVKKNPEKTAKKEVAQKPITKKRMVTNSSSSTAMAAATVTKKQLIADIRKIIAATTLAEKLTVKEIEFLFTLVIGTMRNRIVKGDKLRVSEFGSFHLSKHAGRYMTHPDGNKVFVPDHCVIRFRPADIVRKLANGRLPYKPLQIPDDLCILALPKSGMRKPKRR